MEAMTPCHHENPKDRRCLVHAGNDITWCSLCGGTVHIRPHLNQPILDVEKARTLVCQLMCDSGRWRYTQLPNHDLYGDIPPEHPAWVSLDAAGVEYDRYAEEQGVNSHWEDVPDDTREKFRLKVINVKWKAMRDGTHGSIEIAPETA